MGSLPPRPTVVFDVFMYVFVNVIEAWRSWGVCSPHVDTLTVAKQAPPLLPSGLPRGSQLSGLFEGLLVWGLGSGTNEESLLFFISLTVNHCFFPL